jgi:glycosyltransferase involved in cell wall biosynthesis
MKVAFFCDSYKPYLSGVTNSVDLLAKELRLLGHRIYIFAPRYPGHVDTEPDIIRFPSLPTGYPHFRLALPYINRLPEVEIVHAHSPFQAGILGKYLAHKRKLPFVYTFHTLFTRYVHYAKFIPEPLSKLSLVTYARQFCRRCSLIITPSKMARRVLLSWGIKTNSTIVPTGVDLGQMRKVPPGAREALREKLHLPDGAKVLLYVGRISKEKNLPFLIKAFKKIYSDQKGVYLVLVGGGPLIGEIKKMGLNNLIMAGEVSYPEILAYYFIGDIFVFSSITETQGLVLAEAKAAGLPVVALFAGGLVDTVRSGLDGYLTARNLDNFVLHVKRLLDDRALLGKMGEAAREDAQERFSSKVYAKKVEALYSTLSR